MSDLNSPDLYNGFGCNLILYLSGLYPADPLIF